MSILRRIARNRGLGVLIAACIAAGSALVAHAATPQDDSGRVGRMCAKQLPPEAHQTLKLIERGGPYPYPGKDGSIFENRDDNPLTRHENG